MIGISANNVDINNAKFSIRGVNFKLKSGDMLGLVGRSGSGKSTLIKSLLYKKMIQSGKFEVTVDEKNTDIRRIVGYSPQDNSLYPFLTLEENLMIFGRLHGMKKKDILTKSEMLLKRLDLSNSKKKKIMYMSGGMQKRADLAITLIHDPGIIVLDEPFNGLDVSLQQFIWGLLHELASQGRIIIISSHLLEDIRKNCNQFGLIERGKYFDTERLSTVLSGMKNVTLEKYLERLFSSDMKEEK